MKKKGMAEPKRPFRAAPRTREHSGHLSGIPPRPKRAVNLSVDAELLRVAKEMTINLSRALESALDKLTAEERARRFYEENKAAIDSYNRFIERHGTLAENFYGQDLFSPDDPAV